MQLSALDAVLAVHVKRTELLKREQALLQTKPQVCDPMRPFFS